MGCDFFCFCHVCSQETHSKFKTSIWLCFTLYVFDVTTFWVAQYRHLMCSTVDPDHQLLCIEETLNIRINVVWFISRKYIVLYILRGNIKIICPLSHCLALWSNICRFSKCIQFRKIVSKYLSTCCANIYIYLVHWNAIQMNSTCHTGKITQKTHRLNEQQTSRAIA